MRQNQQFDRRHAHGRPRLHINPRQARAISRPAVDINDVRQYANLRHKAGPLTIKEDKWDDYHVRKSKQWSTRLRHKPFNTSSRQTQMNRTQLVTNIRRIIGRERCYYLCIPVHRRPQTALPANPFDCSTAVLQTISDILNEMEPDRNARPRAVDENVGSAPRLCPPRPDSTATRSTAPNLQPAAVMVAQPQPSHDSRPAAPTEGIPGSSPHDQPARQQPGTRGAATSAVSSTASPSIAPRSLGSSYQPVHEAIALPQTFRSPTTPAPAGASPRPNQQQLYRQQPGVAMQAGPSQNSGPSVNRDSKRPMRGASIPLTPPISPTAAHLKEEVDSRRLHKTRADMILATSKAAQREHNRMGERGEGEDPRAVAGPSSGRR